jgi:Mg2+/Co2+ transporter CorB
MIKHILEHSKNSIGITIFSNAIVMVLVSAFAAITFYGDISNDIAADISYSHWKKRD